MAFITKPLPGNRKFGAVIANLLPSQIVDPGVRKALYDLWIDKGVLVFQGIAGGRDTQLNLSRVFGELEVHPLPEARNVPEEPELIALIYKPGETYVVEVDNEERGAYLPWHSDLIYVDRINRGGLLRAIDIPSRGGYTGFIDQIELYSSLPENLKARIDGLSVIYHNNPDTKKFGKKAKLLRRNKSGTGTPEKYGHVAHPMVFTQTETGRKVLNVSPWFAVGIEGMENVEGDTLLASIIDYCEDDTHAYYHHWQPGDMVLWDNWRMLHCAYGVPVNDTRRVERTTIKGDYALGRLVRGPAIADELRIDI
jgi:taurine dioxygenase